jgi:hypothetical protein
VVDGRGTASDPSLPGQECRAQRELVYLFLAECLADEQRFNTMGRISTDVLGAYLDGDNAISHELLHDALAGNTPLLATSALQLYTTTSG